MKSALTVVLFRLFVIGVFVDGKEESDVSVMEGDSVTLKPGFTDVQKNDRIEGRFNGSRIDKFGDRLQLDSKTGDLKISNIRTKDSGLYKVKISSTRGSSEMEFNVNVVFADEVKSVSVLVGDSVTLRPDPTYIQGSDVIRWRFGQQKSLVAEINRMAGIFKIYDGPDERFRDRLELDHQTVSLTITNINITDAGLYEAEISSRRYTINKSFSMTVSAVIVSVLVGDSVTLHTGFNVIEEKHSVSWFKDQHRITPSTDINKGTGDLTIRNIQRDKSGDYTVKIISSSSTIPDLNRKFHINITGVFSSENDGVKKVSVVNGNNFTLHNNDIDIQNDVLIEWMFGSQNLFIAKTDRKSKNTTYSDDVIFKNKVYLDNQTGDLSIQNSGTEQYGLYLLKIINSRYTIQKNFRVTVSGLSPVKIAGVVVFVLLLVVAAVAGVIYIWKKQQKIIENVSNEEPPQNPALLNGSGNGSGNENRNETELVKL